MQRNHTFLTLEGESYIAAQPLKVTDIAVPEKPAGNCRFDRKTFCWETDEAKELRTKLNAMNGLYKNAGAAQPILSSLGFMLDADEKAIRDVTDLIAFMKAQGITETKFRDAANCMRIVNLEEVKRIQIELIERKHSLYRQKWDSLRDAKIKAGVNLAEKEKV